jgi:hypothetical protein
MFTSLCESHFWPDSYIKYKDKVEAWRLASNGPVALSTEFYSFTIAMGNKFFRFVSVVIIIIQIIKRVEHFLRFPQKMWIFQTNSIDAVHDDSCTRVNQT